MHASCELADEQLLDARTGEAFATSDASGWGGTSSEAGGVSERRFRSPPPPPTAAAPVLVEENVAARIAGRVGGSPMVCAPSPIIASILAALPLLGTIGLACARAALPPEEEEVVASGGGLAPRRAFSFAALRTRFSLAGERGLEADAPKAE